MLWATGIRRSRRPLELTSRCRARLRGATPFATGPGFRRTTRNASRRPFVLWGIGTAAVRKRQAMPSGEGHPLSPGAGPIGVPVGGPLAALGTVALCSLGVSCMHGGSAETGDDAPSDRRRVCRRLFTCGAHNRSGHETIEPACKSVLCPQVYGYSWDLCGWSELGLRKGYACSLQGHQVGAEFHARQFEWRQQVLDRGDAVLDCGSTQIRPVLARHYRRHRAKAQATDTVEKQPAKVLIQFDWGRESSISAERSLVGQRNT